MRQNSSTRWLWFWGCFLTAFSALSVAHALTLVQLIAYVSNSLYKSNGVTPLADGSIVYIFGSGDATNDGPRRVGGTNCIADGTMGDDVFLGSVVIDSSLGPGTFLADSIYFDADTINWLYIRFFDTQNVPITGMVNWGQSPLFAAGNDFGIWEVDFVGNYSATNYCNFVVIPEPGTGQLVLMFAGLLLGLRANAKRKSLAKRKDGPYEHFRAT